MELERESLTPDESRARDAVRALPQAAADPAFRARLGQQFVSGAFEPAPARARRLPWHRRLTEVPLHAGIVPLLPEAPC